MSRSCEITGKKHQTGHNVSHSNIKSKRRFMVNLNNVTLFSDSLRKKFRFRVHTNGFRANLNLSFRAIYFTFGFILLYLTDLPVRAILRFNHTNLI